FQNTSAIPESASFLVLSDGMVFGRQAQIRYTNGPWQFAIENPNTTSLNFGSVDDNLLPDFVGRYNFKGDFGNVSVAAIARQLRADFGTNEEDVLGYGLSVSGRLNAGDGDIRFGLTGGEGLGRYIGLAASRASALDPNGDLEAIASYGGHIAWRQPVGFEQGRTGALSTAVILGVVLMLIVTLLFVVFMERSLRKVHIQYPRRQVGMKVYDGGSSHLPIKVNPAGVIPAIFASSLLLLPTTVSTFSGQENAGPVMSLLLAYFGPGQPLYLLFFASMIVFFTYFYTHNVSFKVDDVADNLKNQNGFIPGVRPGKRTAEHLEYIVNRILVLGAGYLALVCLIPEMVRTELAITAYFGGTSILIIVSVGMDTIQQVQSHLLAHQYEGLIEKSQLRGKNRGRKKGTARR
ncbi:MAG: SecY family transport protein, partial [Pseudomonadota bacterium]